LEKLGINLGFFISQLVNFTLLVALLTVLLYKPILRMLNERKERIARSLADVDAAREAAARAQQDYDKKMVEAQRTAQEIIAKASQASEEVAAEIRAEAQREADSIRRKARDEAAQERAHLLAEVQNQIASLSMMATERVLGQAVDANTQRRLVDQFLAEIGDSKP
jgi:F-type H+-transporting ATPase subunit b